MVGLHIIFLQPASVKCRCDDVRLFLCVSSDGLGCACVLHMLLAQCFCSERVCMYVSICFSLLYLGL